MYIAKKGRLTKREHKHLRGPNAAVLRSIREGVEQLGGEYLGRNPEYRQTGAQWIKTMPGVPFVRAPQ